ncbi:Rpn family recombination-promoting nuclease/putative transposase [Laspinema palackyanum]|uniref:Rpn family recombination-promoting nuclease/putative transposase n=1 Tax=Laspinema palackyanum TaxID=3231601 RepID=UPI00345DC9E2|nr:Rpn family recombination-promoting nuclease/putative transposase [Laspinema sp. D2c]
MYDNICKFLAEHFSLDFARWFVGQAIELTELSLRELSLEPIRDDSLILLQAENFILHLEFPTNPDPQIPFRMADYRVRVYGCFPEKEMRQVVIYLKPTDSPLVYQNQFNLDKFHHEFEVVRLWEQPTELFLNSPGLLPFAALSRTDNPLAVLMQVAQSVEQIEDPEEQANIAAASSILAELILDQESIQRILSRDLMGESSMYQSILDEGLEKGIEQGRQQGFEQVAMNLFRSGMPGAQIINVTGLTRERIEELTRET